MYFYSVKIQAVTSKNREIQRSDILYEDAGYKMEND